MKLKLLATTSSVSLFRVYRFHRNGITLFLQQTIVLKRELFPRYSLYAFWTRLGLLSERSVDVNSEISVPTTGQLRCGDGGETCSQSDWCVLRVSKAQRSAPEVFPVHHNSMPTGSFPGLTCRNQQLQSPGNRVWSWPSISGGILGHKISCWNTSWNNGI